jgi:hypothetical protein
VAVEGTQIPYFAAWFSLANYAGAPCPNYGYFRQLYPDLPVYWSASTQTYWVDDTSLYAQQAAANSINSSLIQPAMTLDDHQTGMNDPAGSSPALQYPTNALLLEAVTVTNGASEATANLIIHAPGQLADQVYDLFYTPILDPPQWYWVYRTQPGETNIWADGLKIPSGFFLLAGTNGPVDPTTGLTAACMALVGPAALTNDLDGNGIADILEVTYLGRLYDSPPPVAFSETWETTTNTPVSIPLAGWDAANNSLTYTVLNTPTNGVLSGTLPNVVYTPAANYDGPDGFTFKVNNGTVDSAPATISINVDGPIGFSIANPLRYVASGTVSYIALLCPRCHSALSELQRPASTH